MSDETNDAFLDALTEKLAETFANDLEYTADDAPIREKYAAGVQRVTQVIEVADPEWERPGNTNLEITYLDRANEERTHFLWDITLSEMLQGSSVRVPVHRRTWTVERP